MARLIAVALVVARREQSEIGRTAVEREIRGDPVAQVPDAVAAVAEQVERAENGIGIEIERGSWPGARIVVDGIDAADKAERMSDLVECDADEIDGAGGDTIAGIEIPREAAAEGNAAIGRAGVDRLTIGIGRDPEGLEIGGIDVEVGVVGRAVVVEHPRARRVVREERQARACREAGDGRRIVGRRLVGRQGSTHRRIGNDLAGRACRSQDARPERREADIQPDGHRVTEKALPERGRSQESRLGLGARSDAPYVVEDERQCAGLEGRHGYV